MPTPYLYNPKQGNFEPMRDFSAEMASQSRDAEASRMAQLALQHSRNQATERVAQMQMQHDAESRAQQALQQQRILQEEARQADLEATLRREQLTSTEKAQAAQNSIYTKMLEKQKEDALKPSPEKLKVQEEEETATERANADLQLYWKAFEAEFKKAGLTFEQALSNPQWVQKLDAMVFGKIQKNLGNLSPRTRFDIKQMKFVPASSKATADQVGGPAAMAGMAPQGPPAPPLTAQPFGAAFTPTPQPPNVAAGPANAWWNMGGLMPRVNIPQPAPMRVNPTFSDMPVPPVVTNRLPRVISIQPAQ